MATDIVMPNLGFDTQEGRLVEWLKEVGDTVQKGEVIAVVESDKANVELESVAAGVLLEQLAAPDEIVKIGAVIARVGQPGEQPAGKPAPAQTVQESQPAAQTVRFRRWRSASPAKTTST
jgi:pyruvate dehydrogenase E2 component (dihydrolipoamide acetyltransferase)